MKQHRVKARVRTFASVLCCVQCSYLSTRFHCMNMLLLLELTVVSAAVAQCSMEHAQLQSYKSPMSAMCTTCCLDNCVIMYLF